MKSRIEVYSMPLNYVCATFTKIQHKLKNKKIFKISKQKVFQVFYARMKHTNKTYKGRKRSINLLQVKLE